MTVELQTISDVKKFVDATGKLMGDVDIVSGRYKIDGKSIMGIFSLDLSKPLQVNVIEKEPEEEKKLFDMLKQAEISAEL